MSAALPAHEPVTIPAALAEPLAEPSADATPGAPAGSAQPDGAEPDAAAGAASRDIADVPALEVISTVALHLISAAAVQLGAVEGEESRQDLDEARKLIAALAGLVDGAAPFLGHHHAAPLRDGVRTLQLAFREASIVPDEPGQGPGEKYTGAVFPRR